MPSRIALSLYEISTWVVPLIVAITFHEAAHGYVARWFGDKTAWLAGRVSLNPLKHVDPFGKRWSGLRFPRFPKCTVAVSANSG